MNGLTLDGINSVFTVESLMTPVEQLLTWDEGTDSRPLFDDQGDLVFDVIPVRSKGRINGLVKSIDLTVQPITHDWLVSRDTSIPDLVTLFYETMKPAFLVIYKNEVIGIISPADLNKLPARFFVYNLVGQLELVLAQAVRKACGNDKEYILRNIIHRSQVESILEKLNNGNVDVNIIQLLFLTDLVELTVKTEAIYKLLGYINEEEAREGLKKLKKLRDRTMHLVKPLIETAPAGVLELHELLGKTREIINLLNHNDNPKDLQNE